MTDDMMDPEQWADVWHSRRQRKKLDRIQHTLRQWALKDETRMLDMFMSWSDKSSMDIIELGCAPGLMLKTLYRLRPCHRFFGIDYSQKALDLTHEYLSQNHIEAGLIYGDIRIYRPEKTYDLVCSFGLIEHFDDPVEIVRAHKKFVAKDGRIVVTVPNLANRYVKRALEKFRPIDLQTHNLKIMDPVALFNAFAESGLKNIRVGGAVGPLLPTPKTTPTLESKLYKIFSCMWDGSLRFLPPQWTWYGYYWATGQP